MDDQTYGFVHNVLLFMKQDANEDPSIRESLEVARECVETAFDIHPDYTTSIGGRDALSLASEVNDELIHRPESPTPSGSSCVMPQTQSSATCVSNWQPLIPAPAPSKVPSLTSFEDSGDAVEYDIMGSELCAAQLFTEATEQYSRAIKLDPTSSQYYLHRAEAYYFLENYEMCIDDCQQAINLDGTCANAYERLGIAYCQINDYESAHEALVLASELEPNNDSYKWLNIVYEKLNEAGSSQSSSVRSTQTDIEVNASHGALKRQNSPISQMQMLEDSGRDDGNWSFSDSDSAN